MPTILIVGPFAGGLRATLLAHSGYELVPVRNAQEAEAAVEAARPDLVLVHQPLAGRKEAEAVASLRKVPGLERVPIILFGPDLVVAGLLGRFAVETHAAARRQAEDQLRLQNAALEAAANAIVITDRDGRVTWTNPAFTRLTGWEAAEVLGQNLSIQRSGRHPPRFYQELWQTILSGRVWQGEMVNRRRDGSLYYEAQTITPVRDQASGAVTHFVAIKVDVTEQRQAREALLQSERRYRTLAEAAHDQIFIVDRSGRLEYINTAGATALGLRPEQVTGRRLEELFAAEVARELRTAIERVIATGTHEYIEQQVEIDHRRAWIGTWLAPLSDEAAVEAVVGVSRDLTERRELEEQLQRAQKIEAIGLLAGGAAHDFNNVLSVIGGYAELALKRTPEHDPLHRNIAAIGQAARRGAELARQLLAFNRKRPVAPTSLDLDDLVLGMEDMLRRLIPEDIELVVATGAGRARAMADRGQMEQVLMNLAVNARDAMPHGGRLIIETRVVELDEARRDGGLRAAPHVVLAVSDTGTGMDPETLSHVFEPFFTTKDPGRGSGLGLSTAHKIVKQAGGSLLAYSEPGRGSVFKVLLPRIDDDAAAAELPAPPRTDELVPGGTETILIVEDEEVLRRLTCELLESLGYTVISAATGLEALALTARHPGPIHLVVTDVVMPGIGGEELAARMLAADPRLRVLLVSGYTERGPHAPRNGHRVSFLEKPFTSLVLGRRVRELLDMQ